MAHKVKVLENRLKMVSHINLKIESLQIQIWELDRRRNIEKSVMSSLQAVNTYDIRLHTLAMNECQELASKFQEKARHNLAGMIELYEESIYDIQRYIQWPEINFKDEHLVSFSFLPRAQR